MKKIIVSAIAVIMGFAAHAAAVEWMVEGIAPFAEGAEIDGSKVFAFESTTLSQSAFLALFAASDDSWTSSAFVAELYEDGAAMGTVTGYDNGAATSTWLAVFDTKGNVLVSDALTDNIGGAGQSAYPTFDLTDASEAGIFNASEGYSAAGWYSAAAVPEPTSGLLLLLGMAGLALRRKQA